MTTITTIAGLFELLRQKRMSAAELMQWLSRRGAVPPAIHKAELARLDEALSGKIIDAQVHQALAAKLRELQSPAQSKSAAADDITAVGPAAAATDRTAAQDDFDLVLPDAPDSEATQVNPEGSAETTAFTPTLARARAAEPVSAPKTGTGTHTSGPPSTSSWERFAAKADSVPEQSVYPGMMLKERFYLEKEVGRGGMGVVYKARDERKVEAQDKNPWVAVKILNDEFRHHPQSLIALQREARKAQQLTHDNILRVYDFDKAGAIVYITMEYADGGTVKEYIKQGAATGGWTYAEGRKVIEGMAHGLARAHRDGIVHSDFKPGNVMVGEGGVPKVFDLGIARAAKTGDQKAGETTVFDAATLGALTPAYASLEMMRGEDPQIPDDVYALAISVYEVLTGKHPYAKKNAEQAMKEGLKPQRIPGLTRKQWQTLEKGLAFERKNRLQTADALVEGMRPRTVKDYALPVSVGTAAAVLVLGAVFGLLLPKLQDARVDGMVRKFEQGAFGDHGAAVQELAAMNDKDRAEVKQRGSTQLQDYFFKVAGEKWDLVAKPKRYAYPEAEAIIKSASALFPDSQRVAENLRRIDEEKKTLLTELDDQFNSHVEAGRIYEDQQPNVVETVAIIRRVDPANDLLKDEKLLGRYTSDVRNALETGHYETAEKRVATAVKVFPQTQDLAALQGNVKLARETQVAMLKERELREKMTAAEAKTELAKLAADPLFTPDWQVSVNVAMSKLTGDSSPETQQLKNNLAEAYARQLAGKLDEKQLVGAQMVADSGLKLFPGAPRLMQEVNRLTQARKAQEAEDAAKTAVAEADSLKRTLKTRADANDIAGAQAALDKLKKFLPAGDPFLAGDGPKALGEAYLRQAEKQAAQNRYSQALKFVADGLKVAPALERLKAAEKQYGLEARVATLEAGARNPATANGDQLKTALAALKTEDPQRHDKVMGDLLSTAVKSIQALIATDRAGATRGKTEWLKVFPQNQQLASLTIPEGASPSASLPQEARRARGAPTPAVACSNSFAGFGASAKASCYDKVAGADGPRLVVVPGLDGSAPFAVTKYEITVGQFNAFCSATGKCAASGENESLPKTNVSFKLAKDYAAWLGDTTGFNYRLPTDAEWSHAANAGGKGAGADFNCVLMQGDQQIKGGTAIDSKNGRASDWGLVNIVGNAAEWVDAGGSPAMRGGHFNVPTSRCTVEWRESSSGDSNSAVGLRLVRDLG